MHAPVKEDDHQEANTIPTSFLEFSDSGGQMPCPNRGKAPCGSAERGRGNTVLRGLRPRIVELAKNPGSAEERVPAAAEHHGSDGGKNDAEGDEERSAHPVDLCASCGEGQQEEARDGGEE